MKTPEEEALDALAWLFRNGVDTDYPPPNENEPLVDYILRIQDERLEAIDNQEANDL